MTTAVQVQYRRGTASQVASFTGAGGELVVDTTNNRAVVQDGSTAGGWPAAKLTDGAVGFTGGTIDGTAVGQTTRAAGSFTTLSASGAFTVTGGTLTAGTSAFSLTATQPASPTASQEAVLWTIAGAGWASQTNYAFEINYTAGYTGNSASVAINGVNSNAGTGSTLIPGAGSNSRVGNVGIGGAANSSTSGLNIGTYGVASAGAANVGLLGLSQGANNGSTNIGVVGSAINTGTTPVQIGGWFSLNQTTTPTVSAALVADNGSQSSPIALFRVNGTTQVSINSDGSIALGAASASGAGNLATSGSLKSTSATAGIGYATGAGAGGAVTQSTSKSTGVALNQITGAITMSSAALAAGTIVSFTLTNSAIAATDLLLLNHISGGTAGSYTLNAQAASGSATINVRNNASGSLSEAIVIAFAVIKGATS